MLNPEADSLLSEELPPAASGRCPFRKVIGSTRATLTPELDSAKSAAPFVSLSKFVIANEMTNEVKEAFRHRPHLVDEQPGFVHLDVFSPLDRPEEIWLVTHWIDAESFKLWHQSHLYRDSHRGIPKGLKLMPGETEIRHFEHICS
jgi:heme-degrading monooxygenase HmoA